MVWDKPTEHEGCVEPDLVVGRTVGCACCATTAQCVTWPSDSIMVG